MLSDEELLNLARNAESERVERKPSGSDRSSIRRGICAFANDLAGHGQPSVVFVGLNDDGSCAGGRVTDRLLRDLASMRDDGNIQPTPSMEVYERRLDGCHVAVIEVQPAPNPPVRYRGRVWVRVGPTNRGATPEEESRLSGRRRAGDLPFDMRPAHDATLDDLDLAYFEQQYLPSALAPDVIEDNNRTPTERLASLRFLTRSVPNYGALLVLGKEPLGWMPGTYLQFLRIAGTELGDPVKDEKRLDAQLTHIMAQVDELLDVHVQVAVDLHVANRDVRRPDYPVRSLQQLIRNALIHRSYEGTTAAVRVYWFDDRIEIASPGGLYGQVTPENFGQGVTDYRNPLVAEARGTLGYVQRYGFGVPLATRLLKDNGNPAPEFHFEPTYVAVTVRASA